jgi:acetyl-CoA carboxylase biotin carboxyl carrier protein
MKSLRAQAKTTGGQVALLAPLVGIFHPRVRAGELVSEGAVFGVITELGVDHVILSPASGTVAEVSRPRPVGYGDALGTLGSLVAGARTEGTADNARAAAGELVFKAPSSGRFFSRPSPDRPPFVKTGDAITAGQVVCLMEVMKTYNQIEYGGAGLPPNARVEKIVPADGDDVTEGDPLLVITTRS